MTVSERILRAYPPAWRERYGDELEALIEDTLDGHRPSVRFQLSIVRSGLGERGRAFGLTGDARSWEDRARAGGLVVMCAWSAFIMAGLVLAKRAEHAGGHGAIELITVVALGALAACVTGVLAAVPSIARFIGGGGWVSVATAIRRSVGVSLLGLAATVGLVLLAGTVPAAERETGTFGYDLAFFGWAAIIVLALASWTAVVVVLGRRVPASAGVLAVEAFTAVVVTAAMVAMTAMVIQWWHSLGSAAPGQLGVIVGFMFVADAVAGYGITVMGRAT